MKDDHFEWDDNKAKANERKHGVSFEEARVCFYDDSAVRAPDAREFYGEDRIVIIGMTDTNMLVVAYTNRNGRIRIISARKAEPYERRRYIEAKNRSRR